MAVGANMDTFDTKQVIVIRKDLKMRQGKSVAQGCHASLGAILTKGNVDLRRTNADELIINLDDSALKEWLSGSFAKVCLYVDSEEELLDIYAKAEKAGLIRCLITDSGRTEFNGVPTKTCLAIGPDFCHEIDKITGHLKLL